MLHRDAGLLRGRGRSQREEEATDEQSNGAADVAADGATGRAGHATTPIQGTAANRRSPPHGCRKLPAAGVARQILFRRQSPHRVQPGDAAGGQPGAEEGDGEEDEDHDREGRRIRRIDAERH